MTTVLPDNSALLEEATKAASIATFQGGNVPQINEMPERRKRKYTIISADDHLVEPPNLFDGRLSAKYGDRAPKLVDMDDGSQVWVLDGQVLSVIAINAVAGQKQDEDLVEPRHFADIREGAYDVHKRVEDMDLDGVYASLCFPSLVGFAGVRLQALPDQKYALDTV
ncbi:MAG: amidohydrolase, partial [Actinobacteria bacterium]|nr:amidohydrolase [Actinomycetota bacterium]